MEPKFKLGESVFAKMKGYPPWPAKIEGIADDNQKKRKYHVYFYGTKQMAVCKEEDLFSYIQNRLKFGKPKKIKGFIESLDQMDEELGLTKGRDVLSKNDMAVEINGTNDSMEKNKKLSLILKEELVLVNLVVGIQHSLNLENPNTKKCLELLDKLLKLNISTLTMKRQPFVIHVTLRLEKYIGNVNSWNLSKEQIESFLTDANEIQLKAKLFNNKIKQLFKVPDGCSFIEYFDNKVKEFTLCTKNLTLDDICCLMSDPTEAEIGLVE